MSEYPSLPDFPKLDGTNYGAWRRQMSARLRASGLWSFADGSFSDPGNGSDCYMDWKLSVDAAAGEIFSCLDRSQWPHVTGIEDNPLAMWKALESANLHRKAGTRFNAFDELFGLRKMDNESLMDFGARAQGAMANLQTLRPATFDLAMLDQELTVMAMLRGLPSDDYGAFVSSVLLHKDITVTVVQDAFQNEEAARCPRTLKAESANSSEVVDTPLSHTSLKGKWCEVCGSYRSHFTDNCKALEHLLVEAKSSPIPPRHITPTRSAQSSNWRQRDLGEFAQNASLRSSTSTS
jgi:hypothetical protein